MPFNKSPNFPFPLKVILTQLFLLNFSFNKLIRLPFNYRTPENSDEISFIKSLLHDHLFVVNEMGTPKQRVEFSLSSEYYDFLVESHNVDSSFYDETASRSFVNITKEKSYFVDVISKGYQANETFYFYSGINSKEKTKFDAITFLFGTEINTKVSGTIGLQITKTIYPNAPSFFQSLKNNDIISKYIWNLNYTTNELIVGEYPHEYDKGNYNEYFLKRTNAIARGTNLYWDLLFTDIMFGDIKINRQRQASISPELGVIVGTHELHNYLKENFFSDLGTKCEEKEYEKYVYYVCDGNTDVNQFKNITFVHQELGFNFTLTKEDLFSNFNNKKYLLVFFDNEYISYRWRLGKPFLRKFNLIFDQTNKLLLYYVNDGSYSAPGYSVFSIVVIVVLLAGVITLGVLIGKQLILKQKKIRANELQDEFSYKKQGEIDENKENALLNTTEDSINSN